VGKRRHSTSLDPTPEQSSPRERARWQAAVEPLLNSQSEALWRAHCDAVNAALLERWLPTVPCARLLKTDLWDEAMGQGLYPLLAERAADVAGIDFVPAVIAAAVARHPQLGAVLADARALPFAAGAFDAVVSISTLDHFASSAEIEVALRELHRVLRPGGRLLLTLDNLANPIVALRNALPYSLLHGIGLVPYPVGATCRPRRLQSLVREAGFEVRETTAILHCPRALSIASARRVRRTATAQAAARFLARLRRWERLAQLPTRYLTGYFVAIHARRP